MGIDTSPERLLRPVLPGDVSVFDQSGVAGALGVVKSIRGFLDAYEARLTSRAAELHTTGESAPPTDLHTRNGGVSSREAQQKERRAEALEQAPAVADELGAGTITGAHADVLANAADHHVIHEPGWELHLAPDRTLTIRRNGDIWAEVPLRPGTATRVVPATETPPEAPDAPPGDAHDPGRLSFAAA